MSMTYKQQMRGWAFDRVTELAKVTKSSIDLAAAMQQAELLVEWAYNNEEAQVDAAQRLYDVLSKAPDGRSGTAEVRLSLDMIEQERTQAGLDKPGIKLASQH